VSRADQDRPRGRAADFHFIDAVCEDFEEEARGGKSPRVEDYLTNCPASLRQSLLRELLLLDLEYRDSPDLSEQEYRARFPHDAAVVGAVFKAVITRSQQQRQTSNANRPQPAGRVELSVISGPHTGKQFVFEKRDRFVVGRGREAHFRLPEKDPRVSRVHFMIEANPPLCQVIDLGSRNGTFVNGTKIQSVALCDGDRIGAGDTEFRIAMADETDAGEHAQLSQATEAWSGALQKAPPQEGIAQTESISLPAIEGYRMVRELGKGGMGVVYLAERQRDAARVAIKTIHPRMEGSSRQVQFFLREAKILRQLRHPHVVPFHEMGQSGRYIFFVMDYVQGIDGQQLLKKKGPLKPTRAVAIACQVLSALHFAHTRGFVHRDVKPSNLLLEKKQGQPKCRLADFGLARAYDSSSISGLTAMGAIGDTLAFMSPEQITDYRNARPTTDQYSLAATLYYLLTGRGLFDFDNLAFEQRIAEVLLKDPVPIRQRRKIPDALARVIHKALAKKAEERFEDCHQLREHLLPFAKS
jgi:serine/threonine-protein kinase